MSGRPDRRAARSSGPAGLIVGLGRPAGGGAGGRPIRGAAVAGGGGVHYVAGRADRDDHADRDGHGRPEGKIWAGRPSEFHGGLASSADY